jgi:DNA-3-methyladenine glycosylase I
MEKMKRCDWTQNDVLMNCYHDEEWGIPVHDDLKWFEFIVLDAFQAGLSWKTILYKREEFRCAFDQFDYKKISGYDSIKVESLMANKGIVRNRLKIIGTIKNANAFMSIQKEFGSFDRYIWSFTEGKTIVNKFTSLKEIPTKTSLSDKICKDLKKRGFTFVGSTIVYSFLQAAGIVNDHLISCYRHDQVQML